MPTIAIMMLTDDKAVTEPVRQILDAAEQELQAFEGVLSLSDRAGVEHRRRVDELREVIQAAMRDLVEYGLKNLRGSQLDRYGIGGRG